MQKQNQQQLTHSDCQYGQNRTQPKHGKPYGCPSCVEQDRQDCNHCFTCGEEGHRAAKASAVASLIGRKALVQSYLNGLAVISVLDSGSQVSIVSCSWKDEYLPDLTIYPVSDILGEEKLKVIAANGSLIPYDGWVAITVNLPRNLDPNLSISVPFLISSYPMEEPLIGFNVLEVLVCGQPERLVPVLASLQCHICSQRNS